MNLPLAVLSCLMRFLCCLLLCCCVLFVFPGSCLCFVKSVFASFPHSREKRVMSVQSTCKKVRCLFFCPVVLFLSSYIVLSLSRFTNIQGLVRLGSRYIGLCDPAAGRQSKGRANVRECAVEDATMANKIAIESAVTSPFQSWVFIEVGGVTADSMAS